MNVDEVVVKLDFVEDTLRTLIFFDAAILQIRFGALVNRFVEHFQAGRAHIRTSWVRLRKCWPSPPRVDPCILVVSGYPAATLRWRAAWLRCGRNRSDPSSALSGALCLARPSCRRRARSSARFPIVPHWQQLAAGAAISAAPGNRQRRRCTAEATSPQ